MILTLEQIKKIIEKKTRNLLKKRTIEKKLRNLLKIRGN